MRRIAALSALVLVGGLLGPSAALADQNGEPDEDKIRWITVEDNFAVVLPNSDTFSEGNAPPEMVQPPVGTRLFIGEVVYDTADGTTRGAEVGRTHIECTAQVVQPIFMCDAALVFNDGSQLNGTVAVAFGAQGPNKPFDIAVIGGTDDYFGATGQMSVRDITDPNDPTAPTTSLYEADLVLPRG